MLMLWFSNIFFKFGRGVSSENPTAALLASLSLYSEMFSLIFFSLSYSSFIPLMRIMERSSISLSIVTLSSNCLSSEDF